MTDAAPVEAEEPVAASLPLTAWAVLGILSFGERTGYECKKYADGSFHFFFWSPSFSQIYAELRRLEQAGYATSRTDGGDGSREKRLYRITGAGEQALQAWVRESPVMPPVLKHSVLLRVWLGHVIGDTDLLRIVEEHREFARRQRAGSRRQRIGAQREPLWSYAEMALEWAEGYYAAEEQLATRLIEQLTARTDPPPA
jgi:DNA-binding PadR family transcriptional regulator